MDWRSMGEWRYAVLVILLTLCTIASLYFGIFLGTGIAYTHLYYIPIALAAVWYQRRAIIAAAYLFGVHLILELMRQGTIDPAVLVRGEIMLLLALMLGMVSENIRRREKTTSEYQSSLLVRTAPVERRLRTRFDGFRAFVRTNTSLQRMEHDRDLHGLITALRDSDAEIRYQAASALGRLRDQGTADALKAAMYDRDPGVRWISAHALGGMGRHAVSTLLEAMKDADPEVRWRAILALAEAGGADAIDELIECLNDEDTYVRERAAIALAGIGELAITACIRALKDSRTEVRKGAVLALGISGEPSAIPQLLEFTVSEDQEIATAAERALRYQKSVMGNGWAISVIRLLKQSDTGIRRGAIRTIAHLKVKEAIPALEDLLQEGDRGLCEDVMEALNVLRRYAGYRYPRE
ncbi:MAG: HEAT repeat domain-containing protein [Methanomicrobiales archaeon]|nr:HEAT repeat domain-containing protein [Methanomicrobiales archaeon]